MKTVYFDNAATTPLRKEVVERMTQVLSNTFGNPSSTHSFGRSAKTLVEASRKSVAKCLNAQASEIIFTSSATEATNWILRGAVKDLGVKRIVTSKIEHHATLHTALHLEAEFGIQVEYVAVLEDGSLDLKHLETLLESEISTIVSLLHVNNETGEILDINRVGALCREQNVLFHCDTVQSVGKVELDLQNIPVDFIVGTAHKFHGPKGVGFAFIRKNNFIQPLIYGGEQEKGVRAGTEAVHQIVGLATALELSYANLGEERSYITGLKETFIQELKRVFPEVKILGKDTLYTVLNVVLPFDTAKTSMLLFTLDIKGVAVSRGSACQSGSIKPSHVLAAFLTEEDQQKPNLRISFSHFNTKEEVEYVIDVLKQLQ
ncbi:cysteine desulfurase family protein [Flavobacterium chuncheonense]|uniref:cysteine desulfurase n=1 Tax=Flavobacterium chuncheonense TaxID=2026653 RepID=A0ABW5YJQ0_9FLAO